MKEDQKLHLRQTEHNPWQMNKVEDMRNNYKKCGKTNSRLCLAFGNVCHKCGGWSCYNYLCISQQGKWWNLQGLWGGQQNWQPKQTLFQAGYRSMSKFASSLGKFMQITGTAIKDLRVTIDYSVIMTTSMNNCIV